MERAVPFSRKITMSIQLVVASGNRVGQVIPIMGERFVIGRADDCHLKPKSELISRYHCEIVVEGGQARVRDMGSKNGVFLNEKRLDEAKELRNSDKLTIGPLEFFVHITLDEKAKKPAKVKSVSEAVARTVAIQQSENEQKYSDDSVVDWLFASGESGNERDTGTLDAMELMAHLREQSEEAANKEREESEQVAVKMDVPPGTPASSRDAASELLRKFFKGG